MKAIQTKLALFTLIALLPLMAFAQTNSAHVWTFATGKTFQADYLTSNDKVVYVRSQGTNYIFGLKSLSANDQYFAQSNYFILEANDLARKGYVELTGSLIENFPEKVNKQRGWMDCKFRELDNIYVEDESDVELGFGVSDKNDDDFDKCALSKVLPVPGDDTGLQHNPLVEYVTGLKRNDKIRLIGTVTASVDSSFRRFEVEKIEMIESKAEQDARENADNDH